MPLEELVNAPNRIIGTKQTTKFINKGQVKKVFLAGDADIDIIVPIMSCCRQNMISVSMVASKKELGKACGIEVGCAAAAIIV